MGFTNICGLWIKTSEKTGKKYFNGIIKGEVVLTVGTKVQIFKNDHKEHEKHPDYNLCYEDGEGDKDRSDSRPARSGNGQRSNDNRDRDRDRDRDRPAPNKDRGRYDQRREDDIPDDIPF